ncbi:Undecaprenyl-diphosphatase [Roseimaritima ulvae]|uniref:Undecaprenyl-diphosphatase n=2 Tax=Roseimaritima ulvae TaxID=980254 RepID=A0A5B9R0S9_9BACT|nr:undecaprenyl-diphosphate phosphatase [Roseimaritima ulvae]QEG43355.1 Undecaprenyl-diphosphatase [Roseimaritima ulvae]
MSWIDVWVLAVVQGIAEFLPISSSGHLVVLGALMEIKDESASLEIILHAGTLASILVVYWQRIWALLRADRRVVPLLVVGTVPAAIVGLTIKKKFEFILHSPLLAGCMFLVTGGLLLTLRWLPKGDTSYQSFGWWRALVVGCFQAFAILPGVSRSGSTIVGGRLLGLKNDDAVTFSFLLAIPAILGATVLAVKDLIDAPPSSEGMGVLLSGAVVAFLVGLVSLRWLIRWSRQGRLDWFAYWCIPAGLLVMVLWYWGLIDAPVKN